MADENAGIKHTDVIERVHSGRVVTTAGIFGAGALVLAYALYAKATGDWFPFDGIDLPDVDSELPSAETPEVKTEVPAENAEPEVVVETPAEPVVEEAATKAAATAAAPCAAEEVVEAVKKVCVGPDETLTATADSSCDGIISLTRQALLQDTSFVTPELVAGIEDAKVQAVYQAILDGDRSALTTALTNLYTENGYFNPANASGALDGLKDSIIIYPGDQVMINEDGWFLKRADGEVVKMVNCDGELLDVKDEAMSDTGKCGDAPVVEKGPIVTTTPVEESPIEDIPDSTFENCKVQVHKFDPRTREVLALSVFDANGNPIPRSEYDQVGELKELASKADGIEFTNGRVRLTEEAANAYFARRNR